MRSLSDENGVDSARSDESPAARLITLTADQVTAAVDEAFHEIDALSQSFITTATHASELLNGEHHPLLAAVQDASIRLQFADRLHQRLSNVSKNLQDFAELIESSELSIDGSEWAVFLKRVRVTFTMEQEREMFDEVFSNDE